MKISFEYLDAGKDWQPITLTTDIDLAVVHQKLDALKREFPDCLLRALDENAQVLAITRN